MNGYDIVLHHEWMEAHPLAAALPRAATDLEPREMIGLALESIRRNAPRGRVTIITNDRARFAGLPPEIAIIERTVAVPGAIAYDRTLAYRDFVAARAAGPRRGAGIVFLDTDVLVVRDLAPLFDHPFDLALTYVEEAVAKPPATLDRWGLPTDGRISAINFGVMAARATPEAVSFFDAALARFAGMIEAGRSFLTARRNRFPVMRKDGPAAGATHIQVTDIRQWGGAQFAMVSLLSPRLFGEFAEDFVLEGVRVRLVPSAQWNFAPNARVTPAMLEGRYVLHFKGMRKPWMAETAALL